MHRSSETGAQRHLPKAYTDQKATGKLVLSYSVHLSTKTTSTCSMRVSRAFSHELIHYLSLWISGLKIMWSQISGLRCRFSSREWGSLRIEGLLQPLPAFQVLKLAKFSILTFSPQNKPCPMLTTKGAKFQGLCHRLFEWGQPILVGKGAYETE